MQIVPIPFDDVEQTAPVWLPLVSAYAKRFGASDDQIADKIYKGEWIAVLAWDEVERRAHALAGVEIERNWNGTKTCHISLISGNNQKLWIGLLPQLEEWAKHLKCSLIKTTCRSGWLKPLKAAGYDQTQIVMEKDLD